MDEGLTKIRHERSKKDFPFLKLEDNEYVEYAFSRAKVCLFAIFAGTGMGVILILVAFLFVLMGQNILDETGKHFLFIILGSLIAATVLIGMVALMIYRGNRLFVTNKHVIQMVMKSPVSTSLNVIDLPSIEDASFHQNGILQKIFGYGTFRLATVGDETTYTFTYSDVTPEELKGVSKLITEAKRRGKRSKSYSEEIEESAEKAEKVEEADVTVDAELTKRADGVAGAKAGEEATVEAEKPVEKTAETEENSTDSKAAKPKKRTRKTKKTGKTEES